MEPGAYPAERIYAEANNQARARMMAGDDRIYLSPMLPLLLAVSLAAQVPDTAHLVLVATTGVHGHITAWDYLAHRAYPGGLARVAKAVDSLRRRYPGQVVVVDRGQSHAGQPVRRISSPSGAAGSRPPRRGDEPGGVRCGYSGWRRSRGRNRGAAPGGGRGTLPLGERQPAFRPGRHAGVPAGCRSAAPGGARGHHRV